VVTVPMFRALWMTPGGIRKGSPVRSVRVGRSSNSIATSHDVPDFGTPRMAVPAGGDPLGDFDKGLDYLPPGDRRGEALQLRSLERGGRG
jgi:hypothetical protein